MRKFLKGIGIFLVVVVIILAIGYAIPGRCAMPCGTPSSYYKHGSTIRRAIWYACLALNGVSSAHTLQHTYAYSIHLAL